jgi:quercetin dioxygenase-like cupin family protein
VVIEIGAGGILSRHPATAPRLLVAVRGSGWVSGGGGERQPIEAGEAVAWELGEEHESGSDEGMTAIVVEGESLGV